MHLTHYHRLRDSLSADRTFDPLRRPALNTDATGIAMRNAAVHQQWSVEITDVQGRLSNLYLWPGTLTRACLKFQVIRGDVVEHQEVTPFFEVSNYEVRCNYRFMMDVPTNCSHIHLFFISEDVHPVSGKPKLIARSRLSFKDIGRCLPLDKYFTLYRRDRVTQNCIAGGYVRLGFYRSRRSMHEGGVAPYNPRMSMDQVSVCSSAHDQAFPFTQPFEHGRDALPPRPASAVPMLVSQELDEFVSGSEDVFESNSTYYGKTDRTLMDVQEHDEGHKSQEGEGAGVNARGSEEADAKGGRSMEHSEEEPRQSSSRRSSHLIPWLSLAIGATLGVIGTVATITFGFLTKRNTRRKHNSKKEIDCH